jgi:hypothetical protein
MQYKSPLNIYVVWHPDFKEGQNYADLIYKTFNRDTEFVLARNLNIPVFYRSAPSQNSNVPISIPYQEADRNAIIALIDDEFFLSDGWDTYLRTEILDKIENNENYRLYPIAISKRAYKVEEDKLSRLQFIKADGIVNDNKEKELTLRWRQIRSRLLHDLSRLMYKIDSVSDTAELTQKEGFNAKPKPPVSLFLSHAKADGVELAKKLKAYIQEEHQMDTFFDANQIAAAYRFDHQILNQFNENTAIIAVLTDKYATREWCKLEISTAKRKKCPLVVVHNLERGEIRSFPYIGNVPSLLWNDNLQDIIDLTLIQVLYARFASIYLEKHVQLFQLDKRYQCILFVNPPELFNQLDIKQEDNADKKTGLVIYPDPPLSGEEFTILKEVLKKVEFTTPLQSFRFL